MARRFVVAAIALGGCGEEEEEGARTGTGERAARGQDFSQKKAAAPGVPTSKHGDNSIQTYGVESESAERAEANAVVQDYLDARVARDWGTVCSLLAREQRKMYDDLGKGRACAEVLRRFGAQASDQGLKREADIEVLSFRVGGKHGFLIYRRPDGVFATAVTHEGDEWKIVSVGPAPLT